MKKIYILWGLVFLAVSAVEGMDTTAVQEALGVTKSQVGDVLDNSHKKTQQNVVPDSYQNFFKVLEKHNDYNTSGLGSRNDVASPRAETEDDRRKNNDAIRQKILDLLLKFQSKKISFDKNWRNDLVWAFTQQKAYDDTALHMYRQFPSATQQELNLLVNADVKSGDGVFASKLNDAHTDLRADLGHWDAWAVRKFMNFGPVKGTLDWMDEHKALLKKLSMLALIGTSLAYISDKVGVSQWIKNKVNESFRRRPPYTIAKLNSKNLLTMNDLILAPETAKQVRELIYLVNRRAEYLKQTGRRINFDTVLLYGPPGTGKTSIAKLIADQTIGDNGKPMHLISLMAADFKQIAAEGDRMIVLRQMFEKAEKMGNTIIFLDEIDSIAQDRAKMNERGLIDTLLHLLNQRSPNVMVIAATNHKNLMDEALLNRFRRKITVELPTVRQRRLILDLNVEKLLVRNDYDVSRLDTGAIALVMPGAAGRDLEAFVVRLRDRLDFDATLIATQEVANDILREMGYLPPLPEETLTEDVALNSEPEPVAG